MRPTPPNPRRAVLSDDRSPGSDGTAVVRVICQNSKVTAISAVPIAICPPAFCKKIFTRDIEMLLLNFHYGKIPDRSSPICFMISPRKNRICNHNTKALCLRIAKNLTCNVNRVHAPDKGVHSNLMMLQAPHRSVRYFCLSQTCSARQKLAIRIDLAVLTSQQQAASPR
jgi:hypothetical protein